MREKIAVISKDENLKNEISSILQLAGYNTLNTSKGVEFFDLVKEKSIKLIICDNQTLDFDGYTLLKMIKKNEISSSIPLIFLNDSFERNQFRKAIELGADDYLLKPIDEENLLNAVELRLEKISNNLSNITQFSEKDKLDLNKLSDLGIKMDKVLQISLKKKHSLFHEGDHVKNLFFLKSGRIKTYKMHEDGKEYITHIYKAGDFIGFESLLTNKSYFETAVALEKCEVGIIPKQDFMEILHNNPEINSRFMRILANEVMKKENQLISLAYDSVKRRVAHSLLYLQKYSGNNHNIIMMPREDIASMVGTAIETVARSLSEFKKSRFIRLEGRKIRILQPDKLQMI
jgi:CRP-like cAMP-binding protein/glutaredoxin